MNTLEIRRALRDLPAVHTGVYAADEIPVYWPRPVAYVFNCDRLSQPGSHWVAIYVDSLGHGTFFDSYGLAPIIDEHRRRIRENCAFYEWNTRQFQSETSSYCGQFCITFLHFMSHNNDFNSFCNIFEHDYNVNDNIVKRYVERIRKNNVIHGTRYAFMQKCRARFKL